MIEIYPGLELTESTYSPDSLESFMEPALPHVQENHDCYILIRMDHIPLP